MTPTASIQSTGALPKGRACTPAQYRRIAAAQTPRHALAIAHAAGPGSHRELRPGRVFGPRGIGAVLLAVATAVASAWSTPAEAKTSAGSREPRVLVGNLDVGDGGSGGIQRTLGAARSGFGQAFATGPTTGGYALGSLGIQVSDFSDGSTAGDDLRVTVNGVADGGGPGEALCALTHPSSLQAPGVSAFGAPAGGDACPRLAKETTYFAVIEWVEPDEAGALAVVPQTFPTDESAASDEDPGGAQGWSIADVSWYLTVASGARAWTAYETTASFKIRLREAAVAAIAANRPATGLPTISGAARVGETLTASVSRIADADGLDNAVFSHQWIRPGGTGTATDIEGATGSTYAPVAADAGATIAVRVTFEDDGGTRETLLSAATETVAAAPEEVEPPAPGVLSVADAEASEEEDATLDFAVTLDPAADAAVTVDYATSDGTATAGADYTGTSGTLTFPAGETAKTVSVPIVDDAVDDGGETLTLTLSQAAGANIGAAAATGIIRDDDSDRLTAAFENVPDEHDGENAFVFRVAFSEEVGISYATLRDESFSTTDGDVTAARRVDGRHDLWEITVEPDSRAAVSIALPGNRACGTTGAVCTRGDDPRPLGNSPSATVAGPPTTPLTASFGDMPATHAGEEFEFRLTFSEEPEVSYVTLSDHAFDETGGTVREAKRRTQGSNLSWDITVKPNGVAAVTIELPATTDCAATSAICTDDGRPLSNAPSATVAGASTASAVVDGPTLTLSWPAPPDGFAPPGGSDFAVRVDGRLLAVASASFRTSGVALHLSESARPGQDVVVDYLGSAMHPLRDAAGAARPPWRDLAATNVTGLAELRVAAGVTEAMADAGLPAADGAASASLAGGAIGDAGLLALAGRTGLRRLDLSDNALVDISALSGLRALESLDLSGNAVSDLSPLAGMTELRRLDLAGNRVVDLWPLGALPHLEVLLLDGNDVADVGALTHLGRLENLGLAGNLVADVGPLADLWSLRRLDLGGNPAPDLSPIGDLETLVWLRLPSADEGAPTHRLVRLRWLLAPNAAGVCLGCGDAAPGHAEAR